MDNQSAEDEVDQAVDFFASVIIPTKALLSAALTNRLMTNLQL